MDLEAELNDFFIAESWPGNTSLAGIPPPRTIDTPPATDDDAAICQECVQNVAVYYCEKCEAICEDCWGSRAVHRRGDPRHSRLLYNEYLLFGDVLMSDLSEKARQELHERDHGTLWFAVDKPEGGVLSLEEFPRFSQAMGEHREQYNNLSTCYPRLVSFIGDTGAGKSSIVRLLIEHPWDPAARREAQNAGVTFTVPVVGRPMVTVPTSGDVHLYRDQVLDSSEVTTPIFYADSEGFDGGQQEPQARKIEQSTLCRIASSLASNFDGASRWAQMGYSYIRRGWRRKIDAVGERETAVKEIFPRLLYNFSDVIVHVILDDGARRMEHHITKLLEWSQISQAGTINRFSSPHLIIVLNKCDVDSEWDPRETKARILKEHEGILDKNETARAARDRLRKFGVSVSSLEDLLEKSYSSVQFLRLPRGTACSRLSDQLRLLHAMIQSCSKAAQTEKANAKLLLSSRSLDQFFKLAFDHYSEGLQKPFDFLEALFSVKPLPNTFSGNIEHMMRAAFDAAKRDVGLGVRTASVAKALAPVICSMIALDTVRTYEDLPGCFEQIYNGDFGFTHSSTNSYAAQVHKALQAFVERSISCDFRDDNGHHCSGKFLTHRSCHYGWNGELIGYGGFTSKALDALETMWEKEMQASLAHVAQLLDDEESADTGQHNRMASDESAVWEMHQQNLVAMHQKLPSLSFGDILTCFWCVRNTVAEILPCRHAICTPCLVAMGRVDSSIDHRVINLDACNLHHSPFQFQQPVRHFHLPKTVGRRVLSIDGGGVRGIVSLKILEAVEERMGGDLPISAFFDLIGGTSAGGLIALGLSLKDWNARDATEVFLSLLSRAFTPSGTWLIPQVIKQFWGGAKYNTEELEKAIREAFGQAGESELLTLSGARSLELPTKVLVTTTEDYGEKGSLLANYARVSHKDNLEESGKETFEYTFEAIFHDIRTMKLWEAARATSAAPLYFAPLDHNGVQYWDGGLYFNNPAHVVMSEAKLIWPSTEGKRPDILLSVGNGFTSGTSRHQAASTEAPLGKKSRVKAGREFFLDIFAHLLTLKNRLEKNMDSEAIWVDRFGDLAKQHPTRYVRLNPKANGTLPRLDDLEALGDSGALQCISKEYLGNVDNQKKIDTAFLTLVATSFYFHPTERSYNAHSGFLTVQGNIMCRFINSSSTMKQFGAVIGKLKNPVIEIVRPNYERLELDEEIISKMEELGHFQLPAQVNLPEYTSEVDIRLVVDGLGQESISGFPMELNFRHGNQGAV